MDNLLDKIKKEGFDSLDDFIKANLHYLSEDKQRLFNSVIGFVNESYQKKYLDKNYYQVAYYSGKG